MATVADLARRLNSRHPRGDALPALILMTDSRRLPDPAAAARRLPAGAMVLFRDYQNKNREAEAVLAYMKTWWTDEQRAVQADISARYAQAAAP